MARRAWAGVRSVGCERWGGNVGGCSVAPYSFRRSTTRAGFEGGLDVSWLFALSAAFEFLRAGGRP